MKKIIALAIVIAISAIILGCEMSSTQPTATQTSNRNNEQIALAAARQFPTPQVDNFNERKVLNEYVKRFDKPGVISYVYLFSHGIFIDYFICKDKPISTRSYMEPEERYYMNGATLQTPSLDGTYGEDNVGWIWIDDEGRIGSWQGTGANLIFFTEELSPSRHARMISAGR